MDPEAPELEEFPPRPRTRGECAAGDRPCPYVSCKYHLYMDVSVETGVIKVNFPDKDVDEIPETCALDVADRGGVVLEQVGEYVNLTRERIRQVEAAGLRKLRFSQLIDESFDVLSLPLKRLLYVPRARYKTPPSR